MNTPARIFLKPGKEAAIRRRHPWIFSGAVDRTEGNPAEGDVAEVLDRAGSFLAMGHWFPGSIAVKIFSFEKAESDERYWISRLQQAYECRKAIGLTQGRVSDAYRLVFTEGDLLPGLIIDYYNGVAVIQTESAGMRTLLPVFTQGLSEIYGDQLKAVYDRTQHAFLSGTSGPVEITETGHRFMVDFIRGQKTGFYLDQRGNRMFAQFYAAGRSVLNACSYSGAFSVYAMKGGAREVFSVDSSSQAIAWTQENLERNGCDLAKHRGEVADIKDFLAASGDLYDMVILDPPAFAKTRLVTNNALHAYIHINTGAIRRLKPGGLLFTFSCSQPVSREMFRSAVQSAAIETGREVRILHHLSQGPDHPVSIFHPEGEYLKGLILEVR